MRGFEDFEELDRVSWEERVDDAQLHDEGPFAVSDLIPDVEPFDSWDSLTIEQKAADRAWCADFRRGKVA